MTGAEISFLVITLVVGILGYLLAKSYFNKKEKETKRSLGTTRRRDSSNIRKQIGELVEQVNSDIDFNEPFSKAIPQPRRNSQINRTEESRGNVDQSYHSNQFSYPILFPHQNYIEDDHKKNRVDNGDYNNTKVEAEDPPRQHDNSSWSSHSSHSSYDSGSSDSGGSDGGGGSD